MGVDKPDVRLVVHAEITGSLENYLQEAGRAGRDQADAKCVLLYDGKDVDTQFSISKMSQIELRDLKSVWRKIGRLNDTAYGKNQSGEIVATGGEILCETENYMSFDRDDRQADTKVKTALAWLERSGLLERRENQNPHLPRPFGPSEFGAGAGRNRKRRLQPTHLGNLPHHCRNRVQRPRRRPFEYRRFGAGHGMQLHRAARHLKRLEELGVLSNDTNITVILRTDYAKPSEKRLLQVPAWEEKLWQILKKRNPRCRPRQLAEPLSKCRLPPNARSRFGSKTPPKSNS